MRHHHHHGSQQQPPQQGYQGYPPSGPPPPQGQYGYPQPQGQYGYPPPQGQYGYPPPPQQQQYYGGPPPPQQGYGQYPPQGPPQQQGYGYGAPPPQQGYGAPPQQQGYGQAPPAQYGGQYGGQYGPPRDVPSLGYDQNQVANVDTSADAESLRNAMKGLGTKDSQLIETLARIPDPVIMANVRRTFEQRYNRNLLNDIHKETSGYYRETAEATVRGPLAQDVWLVHNAIAGVGTKEEILNLVLLGRNQADLDAIKMEYQRQHRQPMATAVKDDLSMKTERLFDMVLNGQRQPESAPVIPEQIDRAATDLQRATEGTKFGADQITVCQIFSSHNDSQLRAISQAFEQKYRKKLDKVIEKEFAGHMEHALLRMLYVAQNKAEADARYLHKAMQGAGTKDHLLVNIVVKAHWNRGHMNAVKQAYRAIYNRDLVPVVKSETSGSYERILVALIG